MGSLEMDQSTLGNSPCDKCGIYNYWRKDRQYLFINFFREFLILERERVCACASGGRRGGRESQADALLRVEPNGGLIP